ncbi:hypothetical protein [Microtetraspora malaysiensis]|uniref:Uncharacterized protein n=1 Tax=Microtetraspora malaysiensis TaxID=161358 RepID=A0ABW6SNR7_9ACTN
MRGDPKIKAVHDVRAAHASIGDAVKGEREAVIAARNVGVSWQRIADAIGTTQPYVSRKYGPLPAPPGKPDPEAADAAVARVAAARKAILDAEMKEIEAVAAARAVGVAWSAIATEVEMEQPNAFVKYRQYITEEVEVSVSVRADAADLLRERRIPRASKSKA